MWPLKSNRRFLWNANIHGIENDWNTRHFYDDFKFKAWLPSFLLWPWMSHTYFDTFWPTSPCFWFCLFLILHILCYPPHKKSSRHPVLVLKRTHLELQYNISTEFRISKTTLICQCKLALMYLMFFVFFVFYAKWKIILLWPTNTFKKGHMALLLQSDFWMQIIHCDTFRLKKKVSFFLVNVLNMFCFENRNVFVLFTYRLVLY